MHKAGDDERPVDRKNTISLRRNVRMSIGENERATQERVVSFFKDSNILDYEYLGNLKDVANKNIREDRLRAYLRLSGYM